MFYITPVWEKHLLESADKEEMHSLLNLADTVRQENVKNQVCIHGIIEFSNHCHSLCTYCGLRAENRVIERFRMSPEEIKKTAVNAVKKLGYKMLVLQSGEDLWYDANKLSWLIKGICRQVKCLLFISIGNRDFETYEKLYKDGAKGSLFRFETSDKRLYQELHPDCCFDERIGHLKFMKEIGYLIASGPIIGLPGQTTDSLIDDIYLMKELGVTMAAMGPFIPAPNTPLEGSQAGTVEMTLKMIALARLIYPKVRIPIATALEKLGGNATRIRALKGGANAFMLNLTPPNYRKHYQIYPGKNSMAIHQHSKETVEDLTRIIKSCSRYVCKGWGVDFILNKKRFLSGCAMSG